MEIRLIREGSRYKKEVRSEVYHTLNRINMNILIAKTDTDIAACYPVMRELRPHIVESEFLSRVRIQKKGGYLLAFVQETVGPVAVAGFRIGENLAWGRFLYVDDLVTHPAYRSKGYGAALLTWLCEYAEREGCLQLHLDSGMQRKEAHRFYEREGMKRTSYHFCQEIAPNALRPTSSLSRRRT